MLQQALFISLCCFFAWSRAEVGSAIAQDVVQFDIVYRKDSDLGVKLIRTFTAAFHQIGYRFAVDHFPSKRGIDALKNKRVDGTVARAGDLETLHGITGYIRLDVPLHYTTLSLYCMRDAEGMKSLKNPRIAYLNSSLIAARVASRIEDKSVQISAVPNYRSTLVMMQRSRMDCMMSSEAHLDTERLGPDELHGVFRHHLITMPTYSWIAKKYEMWKPLLEKELRHLVADKEWKKRYLDVKARCGASFVYLCPDGRIFARQLKVKDEILGPIRG
jgi:hypothetical protein